MANKNRKCLACQTKYSYCPTCSRADAIAPSWKSEFCCEACKDMWTVLVKFNMNMLTKSEARDIIETLDLKPIDSYVDCVQRDYNKIMAEEKKPRRFPKKFEPVIEEAQIIEPVVEVVLEQVVEDITAHEVVLTEENKSLISFTTIDKTTISPVRLVSIA